MTYLKYINGCLLACVFILLSQNSIAQPNWSVHAPDFQYSMTMTGVGLYSCIATDDDADIVAAFINGECRGVQTFSTDVNGEKLAYLIIYDNDPTGNDIEFQLYDASEDEVLDVVYDGMFEENASFGNADTPYEFKTEYELIDLFIDNDVLLENAVEGVLVASVMAVNEVGDTITLNIDFQNDTLGLDNSYFSISGNNLILDQNVDIRVKDQYEVHLLVVAPNTNCTISKNFVINVTNTNVPPTGLAEPIVSVEENEPIGTLINELLAIDDSPADIHSYEIGEDSVEYPDNMAFEIVGSELLTNEIFDYEIKNQYTIQVKITDDTGNSILTKVTVNILDVVELGDLKAGNLITPNDDGHNDYFVIPNVELFADYRLTIFNDNGNAVFKAERNYDNSWNGLTPNGKELPSGTYYYLLRDKLDAENSFIGNLHLHRTNKF